MPSRTHELFIEVLRLQPWLAAYFVSRIAAGGIWSGEVDVQALPARLNQLTPVEFEADAAFMVGNPPYAGLIVEVQLGIDARKRFSWPYYAAALRARHGLPVELLVVTTSAAVERWARQQFATSHANKWSPLVLGPMMFATLAQSATEALRIHLNVFYRLMTAGHQLSRETDAVEVDAAEDDVAVERELSTMRHIYKTSQLDEDTKKLYFDIILWTAPGVIRAAMEKSMNASQEREFQSFFRGMYDKGFNKGVDAGRVAALRESLRNILQARGLSTDESGRERIDACEHDETLERWITQAVAAESVSEALR